MKSIYIPVLSIASGVKHIDFYTKAFGATERWRISNDDGSVHVASFSIDRAEFRLHEESKDGPNKSPGAAGATTVTIVLTTEDVHAVFDRALAAGATESSPVTDFEYGYRQGIIKDPFGHLWIIEKMISQEMVDRFLAQLSAH